MVEKTESKLAAALAKAQSSDDKHNEASILIKMFSSGKRARANHKTYPNLIVHLFSHLAFASSGCWIWLRYRDPLGYGRVGKIIGESRAHRHSWKLFNGDIPNGMKVLHKCDVRCCVNPDHLFIGTQDDNMKDCANKGRIVAIKQFGEKNPMAKLNKDTVKRMKLLRQSGMSYAKIASQFNVASMTAYRAINGVSWNE